MYRKNLDDFYGAIITFRVLLCSSALYVNPPVQALKLFNVKDGQWPTYLGGNRYVLLACVPWTEKGFAL